MNGLMMNIPLSVTAIMEHAERVSGGTEIVSVTRDNPRHRYTYREAFSRTRQLANTIAGWGLARGDRIATLAWNDYRHFETYYAAACSGYVCHTINPRLFPEQVAYIINHAEDQYVFFDADFLPLVEGIAGQCPGVRGWVVLTSEAHMPATGLANSLCYETLVAAGDTVFEWPELDENTACALCYTSGTTGNPKGVLYSHRSTMLHAYATMMPDAMGLSGRDVVMPIVPMFHVNAWGTALFLPDGGGQAGISRQQDGRWGHPGRADQRGGRHHVRRCADGLAGPAGLSQVARASGSSPCSVSSWAAPPARSPSWRIWTGTGWKPGSAGA